jgi:hypothetical protein
MAILLTILKILGIIILVILGLVLLIILLVLFSPISYRISADHNENDTRAKLKVSFLILNVVGSFVKGEGLDYYAKVLFFKVFSKDKSKPKEDYFAVDLPDEEDFAEEENGASLDNAGGDSDVSTGYTPENTSDNISVNESDDIQDNISVNESDDNQNNISLNEESDNSDLNVESEQTFTDGEAEKRKKEKVPLGEKLDRASEKLDGALYKADETLDKLDKKYVDAIKKLDHIDQFLDRPYVQKTIKRVFKIIKRLFGTIKPKKSKGYIHMGLGSAADTGMILGKISMFYPLWGSWLTVEPDFYYKVIEGNIDIKGRIYLFRFIGPAIGMALTPSLWKTIKLAKKI